MARDQAEQTKVESLVSKLPRTAQAFLEAFSATDVTVEGTDGGGSVVTLLFKGFEDAAAATERVAEVAMQLDCDPAVDSVRFAVDTSGTGGDDRPAGSVVAVREPDDQDSGRPLPDIEVWVEDVSPHAGLEDEYAVAGHIEDVAIAVESVAGVAAARSRPAEGGEQ